MNYPHFILLLSVLSSSLSTAKAELSWSIDDIAKPSDFHCYKKTAPSNDELLAVVLKIEASRLDAALETLLKDRHGRISTTKISENAITESQRVFGQRVGLQLLYIFTQYRINASHFQRETTSPWKAKELDDVILALSDLPDHLTPFPLNRYIDDKGYLSIFRHKRGDPKFDDFGAPTYADAAITLYDAWCELPSEFPRRNRVFHEIAHNLQNMIRYTNEGNWENLSQKNRNESAFVTRYAKTNPSEDLAESMIAYRYVPRWLKKRNPEKYEYIREVYFDGIEYTSEEACKNGNRTILKGYVAEMNQAFSGQQWDQADPKLGKGKNDCDTKYIQNLSKAEHDQCLASVFTNWFRQQFRSEFIKYQEDMLDVRSLDGTGGIPDPKLNSGMKAKIGKTSRTTIRNTFITDFNAFKNEVGTDASNCDQFASQFSDWIKKSNGRNSAIPSYVITKFLRLVCEKGVATRPSYIEFLEKFKGQGPLTSSEFQHGISEVSP